VDIDWVGCSRSGVCSDKLVIKILALTLNCDCITRERVTDVVVDFLLHGNCRPSDGHLRIAALTVIIICSVPVLDVYLQN